MPFLDYAAIKARIPVEAALPLLNLVLSQHGDQWRGPRPTCRGGGERALVVTKGKGFYCFAVKKGGSVLDLVQHIRGGTVQEAAAFLTVPEERQGLREAARSVPPSDRLEHIALGLEPNHEECQKLGLSPETLKHFKGGYEKRGVARGNVIVQLHDHRGKLIGYVGLGDPIWLPKDVKADEVFLNISRITSGEIYLAPHPRQVLIGFENGVDNIIAPLTPTLSPSQLRLLADICEEKDCVTLPT